MTRSLIVCDVESTGLTPGIHVPIEIAVINTATGEELYIAPDVYPEAWAQLDPEAMRINRYFERRVYLSITDPEDERSRAEALADMLRGNTIAGSNPSFDRDMLAVWFARFDLTLTAHHRMLDLASFAAGILDLDHLPGLAEVCERVGLGTGPDHSAMVDARVTWQCFRGLREIRAGVRRPA